MWEERNIIFPFLDLDSGSCARIVCPVVALLRDASFCVFPIIDGYPSSTTLPSAEKGSMGCTKVRKYKRNLTYNLTTFGLMDLRGAVL